MDISLIIKTLAKNKKMSQREVADRLGIVPATINNYFNGKTSIPAQLLPKFAKLFNVSIDIFFKNDITFKKLENITSDPQAIYHTKCSQCSKKDKTIAELKEKYDELHEKYTEVLEDLLAKKSASA